MQFCPTCDSVMVPDTVNKKRVMRCRKCNTTEEVKNAESYSFEDDYSDKKTNGIIEINQDSQQLPTVREECSKCKNKEAYWWMYQTRSSDEPITKFLRCTKCSHTWRDYH